MQSTATSNLEADLFCNFARPVSRDSGYFGSECRRHLLSYFLCWHRRRAGVEVATSQSHTPAAESKDLFCLSRVHERLPPARGVLTFVSDVATRFLALHSIGIAVAHSLYCLLRARPPYVRPSALRFRSKQWHLRAGSRQEAF